MKDNKSRNNGKCSFFLLALAFVGVLATSCSEDKYSSAPPQFTDMTFTNLDGGTTYAVGDRIVVTAVQSSRGSYLYGIKYAWDVTPETGVSYESNNSATATLGIDNPVDTLVFNSAGTYTIKFNGTYRASADVEQYNSTSNIDGGTITYTTYGVSGGAYGRYEVAVEKAIKISNK